MGINRRNADYVLKYNKRSLYPIVDDKIITKERAIAAGIHVPQMYGIISTEKEIEKLDDIIGGRRGFVIKPAQGAGGDGILVIADRFEERFRTISGRIISHEEIEHQISSILTGLYSLGGHRDRALIEYRVTPDPIFKSISYEGVPDIRVIVLMGYPVMAMLRLPTRQSGGKANLHQGAIGVGAAPGLTTSSANTPTPPMPWMACNCRTGTVSCAWPPNAMNCVASATSVWTWCWIRIAAR